MKKKKIVVVDDDREIRELANYIVEDSLPGAVIRLAENGLEGWQMIMSDKPDIVITDVNMPLMNGIELLKNIKKTFPDLKVIVATALPEIYQKEIIHLGGMLLPKPFSYKSLRKILRRLR
ncbi:MAG TPA: response regulator [Candidatus Campbellbacteria bacterium]|nr:response regulator [Candidatus Campbellbacteria bacterium]